MLSLPEPGTYENMSAGNQAAVGEWLSALAQQHEHGGRGDRKVGLWVYGARRSGTTYEASVAVHDAVCKANRDLYGIIAWDYVTAEEAIELVAQGWDETVRINPKDDAAWFEALEVEKRLDRLWKGCDLLWLDDMHIGVTNMNFIERHLFPKLESRVKHGMATVVTTSLEARHLAHLEPVVRDLFVMVEANRAVR